MGALTAKKRKQRKRRLRFRNETPHHQTEKVVSISWKQSHPDHYFACATGQCRGKKGSESNKFGVQAGARSLFIVRFLALGERQRGSCKLVGIFLLVRTSVT